MSWLGDELRKNLELAAEQAQSAMNELDHEMNESLVKLALVLDAAFPFCCNYCFISWLEGGGI